MRDGTLPPVDPTLATLVRSALAEDLGPGDWTTLWTVPDGRRGGARVVAKEALVVAGTAAMEEVFRQVEPAVEVEVVLPGGAGAEPDDTVVRLEGPLRAILTGERTALNFLARLSGIATLTRRYVDAVEGTGARVVDTRKTTPGWRVLEKAAVRAGGGANHRMGLHDMVMIKDNHIAAAGGIGPAIRRVREANDRRLPVEVEVTDLEELEEVLDHLDAGVGRVLLDNMAPELLRRCVERVREVPAPRRPELEASGNVTLHTIREVAGTGVDLVSVGALTHSAPAADLSLRVER